MREGLGGFEEALKSYREPIGDHEADEIIFDESADNPPPGRYEVPGKEARESEDRKNRNERSGADDIEI